MTVAHGYIAAGGQNSQLDVRTLGGAAVYKGHCGGSVNNALQVAADDSGQLRLYVCNNDDTVKVSGCRCCGVMWLPTGLCKASLHWPHK